MLIATLAAHTVLAGAFLPPDFPSPTTPSTSASPQARAFLSLIEASDSTREQRQEAWAKLLASGKRPPKSVGRAVEHARRRAWKQLDDLLRSQAVREAASGLHKAIAPHQAKARDVVHGAGFSNATLDQAMAPITQALDKATAPLKGAERFAAIRATIDEMEGYAAGCALRHGWSEQLGDTLCTLRLVGRYAGTPTWLKVLDTNRRVGAWIGPGEYACVARLNVHRVLLGIRPAEIDLRLVVAAKKHCEEMAAKGYFSHTSPTPALASPWQRAAREHTRANGECIAAGSRSGVGAFRMWYYSQGHHKIMISGAPAIGVGRHGGKWTLMTGPARMRGTTAGKMAQYVRRRYQAGDDAAKLLDLARWCVDSRLLTQAEDELIRVLHLDPDNSRAEKALARLRAMKP